MIMMINILPFLDLPSYTFEVVDREEEEKGDNEYRRNIQIGGS